MTIVAAVVTPEGAWMGADSLASSTDLRVDSSSPKVFRFRNFLLGFAGSYGTGQLLRQVLREEPDLTLKQLVTRYEPPGSDWEVLLVDTMGVYEYQPHGGLIKMRSRQGCSYSAIGSGSSVALGSLYSWHDGRESLLSSLKAAATHTNRVRGPFKIVTI